MKEILTAPPVTDERLVLLEQQMALGAYLDALLAPAPVTEEEADASPPVKERPGPAVKTLEQPPSPVRAPEAVEPPTGQLVRPATERADGRPAWAGAPFPGLLFRVAGLRLAVPLARLNGVLAWDAAAVARPPGGATWFLGLRSHQGVQVRLVDTAAVVLPPERRAGAAPGNVLLIDDRRWGLVCDGIGEVVRLEPEGVKWRGRQGRRQWLAGTVIEHMCALLDVDELARMLASEGEGG